MIKFTKAQMQFIKSKFPEIDELEFAKEAFDFEPKKKVMKEVPEEERCVATKKNGERCTKKRGKECGDMCSIHHGKPLTSSVEVPTLPEKVKCIAATKKGDPCKKNAIDGKFCSVHAKITEVSDVLSQPAVVEVA
jgi:hypothetical protein